MTNPDLAALSKAATKGEAKAVSAFLACLVNEYRAGRLVQIDEGMRERVARALYEEDDVWHKAWPWPDLQEAQGTSDAYRRLADAAIAAMGGAK